MVELRAAAGGGATLPKRRGRVGTAGRRLAERFDDAAVAEGAYAAPLEKRARHRYIEAGEGPLSRLLRVEADLVVQLESASKFDMGLAIALDRACRQLARMRSSTRRTHARGAAQLELSGLAA